MKNIYFHFCSPFNDRFFLSKHELYVLVTIDVKFLLYGFKKWKQEKQLNIFKILMKQYIMCWERGTNLPQILGGEVKKEELGGEFTAKLCLFHVNRSTEDSWLQTCRGSTRCDLSAAVCSCAHSENTDWAFYSFYFGGWGTFGGFGGFREFGEVEKWDGTGATFCWHCSLGRWGKVLGRRVGPEQYNVPLRLFLSDAGASPWWGSQRHGSWDLSPCLFIEGN